MHRMISRSNELNDESILPDKVAYTTLLQVLSKSSQPESIDRAQKWFEDMDRQYRDGDDSLKPNKVTYTALINCWCTSSRPEAAEEAERILACMEEEYEKGDFDSKPDAYTYGSVIKTWSRSRSKDKATRAWELYKQMKKQYQSGNVELRPNDVIITSIISTCGHSSSSDDLRKVSLKVLVECLAEIKNEDYISPTSITYRTLLDAIKKIVIDDEKRCPLSASVFQRCCVSGQLDASVLDALKRTQPELYSKLPFTVAHGSVLETEIPSDWTRNVPKHGRY